MIVALDANCLVAWASKKNQDNVARLDEMLRIVSSANGRVIIPMPCFAEYLVGADESTAGWMAALEKRKSVVLAPFDRRAAFECALMDRRALGQGDKRGGRKDHWQHIKVDRQIIAIAKVHQAERVISEDSGLRSTALSIGLEATPLSELPLPDSALQTKLDLAWPSGGTEQAGGPS